MIPDTQAPVWHALGLSDAFEVLASGPGGLSDGEAQRRLAQDGPNALPEPPRRGLAGIVFAQVRSPLIALLLAAAGVSVALGDHEDAVFILVVVAINTLIGATQEYRAEANTAALRARIRTEARVRRAGAVQRIDSRDLVAGDVVVLEAGDRVPADLRLIHASLAQADEAMLTGESLPVDKAELHALPADTRLAERGNMLHAGTLLQRGRSEAVVVATGSATAIGHIARALEAPSAGLPLIRRLDRFSTVLGVVALALVGLVVAIQLANGVGLRETFFFAIALAVSVIPEGLPVAVTIALAVATRRMARRHVIVRQLAAVEGLGACTVIATDKTGTLTVNKVAARRLWLPQSGMLAVEAGAALPETAHDLAQAGALCNDASLDDGGSGDAVDIAFLELAGQAGLDVAALARTGHRLGELPFDAARRYAAVLGAAGAGARLSVKGAAEVILPLCADPSLAARALAEAEAMAGDGYRVLAVAARAFAEVPGGRSEAALEAEVRGLDLLGLVGFIDPLRPEAREAVAACHRAGVEVKMITGDHAATALAIARDLGIAERADEVVTGRDLEAGTRLGARAAERLARARVFARVEPSQKVEIVEALQARGHLVAMTGDGVNDAPALKRADLGVAMGRGGTDVARDVSDLVLADDNFASIVAGIEEGRAAYANIRKVILLLIATGAAEVVIVLLAVLTGLPAPLTAVQLLWLNLVTNGGQDVALAFEKGEPDLLDRRPRPVDEPLFDRLMLRQVAIVGLYMGVVGYGVFAYALSLGWSEAEARNVTLFLMVLFENVYVFACRSETRSLFRVPLRDNWWVVAAVCGAQLLHLAAPYIPGLRDVLEVSPIRPEVWLLLLPLAASLVAVVEIDKVLRRRAGARPVPA
ncbi:cation-translocating P-type ATPase [Aquabacter cavernae]|uniref:cation-translocating P-type ATPase n=1 Tax=Aquabacter cavernae TaxID=2496029 RepID=UPI000F8E0855|nr:HAD-IC family P-type ATPase [Aquabacter cavernae]